MVKKPEIRNSNSAFLQSGHDGPAGEIDTENSHAFTKTDI